MQSNLAQFIVILAANYAQLQALFLDLSDETRELYIGPITLHLWTTIVAMAVSSASLLPNFFWGLGLAELVAIQRRRQHNDWNHWGVKVYVTHCRDRGSHVVVKFKFETTDSQAYQVYCRLVSRMLVDSGATRLRRVTRARP